MAQRDRVMVMFTGGVCSWSRIHNVYRMLAARVLDCFLMARGERRYARGLTVTAQNGLAMIILQTRQPAKSYPLAGSYSKTY